MGEPRGQSYFLIVAASIFPYTAAAGCALSAKPCMLVGIAVGAMQSFEFQIVLNAPLKTVFAIYVDTDRWRNRNLFGDIRWVQGTPCVSGPDTGAMGVHFVLPARIAAGVLQADEPEALIYEPLAGGSFRLVGVEFIVLASVWQGQNPSGGTPALEGDLLNYVGAPNRYGLPAFYELHVWAWENNPKGTFADWNTAVSCDKQAAN